jgi:imidazole glycerol-phosphate synthase subunit HisH
MIVVIDYGGGNVRSVQNALDRLNVDYEVTNDPEVVANASKVIFPGQGAAGQAMQAIESLGLADVIKSLTVPYLGICIGMQILFEKSEEGMVECLGVLPGTLKRFNSKDLKIPQMGWNKVKFSGKSVLFKNIEDMASFYFVHSYVADLCDSTVGVTLYGQPFTSIVQKDNFYGSQFHPEKSGDVGSQLLLNFIES